jgi:drug/metabolite transporter (DMT)-like permease
LVIREALVSDYFGELAGLGTSICWSFTSVLFTLSGRQVGSTVVNRARLLIAVLLVSLAHLITFGRPFPYEASIERWGWLALSGIIGFAIGDAFLFQAFIMIGPRLAMLLMALSPVMGAGLAWLLLGETLTTQQLLGVLLTVGGVAWVVLDRAADANGRHEAISPRYYLIGILMGLGGALGQAAGYVASKKGLEGDFPALSANMIRLIASTSLIWLITLASRQARPTFRTLRAHPEALKYILGGAIFGPFIGVWFSLVAVQNTPVGVASTLTSLMPVFLLPVGYLMFQERITRRAILGTILAVVGIAVLFLQA